MRVNVTAFAERQIAATGEYIEQTWGRAHRIKFKQRLRQVISLLRKNSNMGAVEPLLMQYARTYRSIVATTQNKIIYVIDSDQIDIVAFWDVRREPAVLADEVIKETNK
jgi:plasmid stabilization system protein ParE